MNGPVKGMNCALGCWVMAAGIGALATILLLVLGNAGIPASIFLGAVMFGATGLLTGWIFCRPLPMPGDVRMTAPMAKPAPAPTAVSPTKASPTQTAPASPSATVSSAASVTASAPLAGQAELAERKGTWKYQGDAPAAAPGSTDSAGGDVDAGVKPVMLDAPRDDGADDLKRIKGIGPKLEDLCNNLGFYHFDQIANWSDAEVTWVDQNLEGFKGRVTRDTWVAQAKLLASGAETEFSKRVDKGNVY